MCSCLQCPELSELVHFLLWELSLSFYTFHRHRVCLVYRVGLIWSLYSWWEAFRSSSLATLPLGFNCGFISTSACGLSFGFCSWGCPGGLASVPMRTWSTAPSPWCCSTILKLQLSVPAPSRGPVSLSSVCMAATRTLWFSFHLGRHRSAVSLSSLNVSPLTQTVAPTWGLDPCFSSPTHLRQVQS